MRFKKLFLTTIFTLLATVGWASVGNVNANAAVNLSGLNVPISQAKKYTPIESSVFPNRDITYYIASSSSYYHNIWTNAAKTWTKDDKYIKLTPVTNENKAQMILTTRADSPDGNNRLAGLTWSFASTQNSKYNNFTVSRLYRQTLKDYQYSTTERTHVAEHEIGHTLGLGVTKNFGSIEYVSTRDQIISTPDINSINKIYKNEPAHLSTSFYNTNISQDGCVY